MTNTNKQHHTIKIEPSAFLLDNWKLWLASDVIIQLKEKTEVSLSLTSICSHFSSIDSKIFSSVVEKFQAKLDSLKSQASSVEQICSYRNASEEFYLKSVFPELYRVGQDLKYQSTKYLRKSLSKDFQQASPKKLIGFLEDLVEILFLQRQGFEELKIYYRTTGESANKAFNNLTNAPSAFDSMLNATNIIVNSKLQRDISDFCSQTLFNLIQLCQSYCEVGRRSFEMLSQVEYSVKSKCSVELISLPVFTSLNKIDLEEQRKLIEIWTGHCINHLGNTPVTWQQLEAKILQNVESPAQKLYCDFQACFLEHISISKDMN